MENSKSATPPSAEQVTRVLNLFQQVKDPFQRGKVLGKLEFDQNDILQGAVPMSEEITLLDKDFAVYGDAIKVHQFSFGKTLVSLYALRCYSRAVSRRWEMHRLYIPCISYHQWRKVLRQELWTPCVPHPNLRMMD